MLLRVNKNPGVQDLRRFTGLLIVFTAAAAFFLRHKPQACVGAASLGLLLTVLTLVSPKAAKKIYVAWMSWGALVGTGISYVMMAVIYFLIVTPLGLFFRLMNRDTLRLKRRPEEGTYWVPLDDASRSSYDHLF